MGYFKIIKLAFKRREEDLHEKLMQIEIRSKHLALQEEKYFHAKEMGKYKYIERNIAQRPKKYFYKI
jgi:hypothetical protein